MVKPIPPVWECDFKKGKVIFAFTELQKIHGPFKFYIEPLTPEEGWTIGPEQIYQRWLQNSVEASFEHTLIASVEDFHFRAVTLTPSEEWPLAEGTV